MPKFSRRILLFSILPIALLLALNVYILYGMDRTSPKVQPAVPFPNFTTKDIYGNTVTQDIFAGNFSLVYLWVTKDEDISQNLRGLMAKLPKETSQPIQIIGIVGDVKEGDAPKIALAQSLVEDLPPNMTHILPNDAMASFLQEAKSVPFICFVDGKGNFIGQPIVGNEPELVKKEFERLRMENPIAIETAVKVQEGLFGRP